MRNSVFANGIGLLGFRSSGLDQLVSARNFSTFNWLANGPRSDTGTAFLFDSSGNDHVDASNQRLTLTGDGYEVVLNDMPRVFVTANRGGNNTISVDDSYTGELFREGDWIDV